MSEGKVVFLAGQRVNLRPILKADIPRLLRWINDPEVRYYLEAYLPVTEADEESWLEGLSARKSNDMIFAIETVEGVHIGNMGLHKIHWRDRRAITGALIGDKEYWGKGLGTEAKMLLLNYCFNTLNLRKICSEVLEYNERSRRYSEKCGYKPEGILREQIFRDGKYWDLHQLAVFKDDFTPLWDEWNKK